MAVSCVKTAEVKGGLSVGARVCTQGTLGSSAKRALLFRPLPSRDQDGKYTGSPAPSPLLSENPSQTRPSEGAWI